MDYGSAIVGATETVGVEVPSSSLKRVTILAAIGAAIYFFGRGFLHSMSTR